MRVELGTYLRIIVSEMAEKNNKTDKDLKVKETDSSKTKPSTPTGSGSNSEYVTSKEFKSYMNKLISRLDAVLEENKKLREEAVVRDEEIRKLSKKVDNLEQRLRINNVEIVNFPITTNEKPAEIIKATAQLVGLEVKDEDIQAVHRVPRYDNKVKNIVVQFVSRWKKNLFIQSCINYRKANNNKISASTINPNLPDEPVYVSEHLSPKMKILLGKTKNRVKAAGWRNAHTRDGVIFAKKDENDKRKTMITDEADLDKIA